MADPVQSSAVRIDKWLWAARFFKHRSAATAAVAGGKVKLNGAAVKAAHAVKAGDHIEISLDESRLSLRVLALGERRGPASFAQTLYEKSADSLARRAAAREARRLATAPGAELRGRPTKRDRRQMEQLRERLRER